MKWGYKGVQTINKKTIISYIAVAVLAFAAGWFMLGGGAGNGNDVNKRLSELENRITTAETEQRKTTEAIQAAKGTAGSIRETAESIQSGLDAAAATADRGAAESTAAGNALHDARATADESGAVISDSAKRISDCESIFERIEQSNKIRATSGAAKGVSP